MILRIFANSGPVVYISPKVIFHLGNIPITNSIFYGWLVFIFAVIFLIYISRRVKIKPARGIVQLIEYAFEFIINLINTSFEDKNKAKKYQPYFITLFLIILINNEFELFPFAGEALKSMGWPLLRPFTADLNATFAMAAITMGYVYYSSVKESGGFRKYLGHFFVGSPFNPLYLIIGILEMITDLTRVFSLSLRLFLNVTIGEIVIGVFSYLGQFLAPVSALPFSLIEVFIMALQAYIFTVLSVMYLAIVVNHASEKEVQTA
jgi:F-type H+-transporting ATPase subunit a